jgi:hypothetical protein
MMPPAPADQPGLVEDFVDIFAAPAKVFARRAKEGGAAAFFAVAIALAAILYSGKNVMEPIMEAQTTKAMAAAQAMNPSMTAEQVQAGIAMQKKLMPVFMIVGAPLTLFVVGLLVWAVGKPFGAAITFGSSMMIAAFAYVPRIIGGVIIDVQGLLTNDFSTLVNPSQVSLSPARFLDAATANAAVLALLLRFDLITIWVTVLIGVAYASAGKMPKGRAIVAASVVWLVGTLFALWGALRSG